MPDHIVGKRESLCLVAAYLFERLEELGIKTHYLGVVEGERVKEGGGVEEGNWKDGIEVT